jgi:hypothetical protein
MWAGRPMTVSIQGESVMSTPKLEPKIVNGA